MTSEVAVLNKSAVALATDSKVTVGSANQSKTYDTVNKLFMLSKTEPVGVMIYGNAEFMEFPWETIIKQYRSDTDGYFCSTIEDYGEDFIAYLTQFFDFDHLDSSSNVNNILSTWFETMMHTCHIRMRGAGGALKQEVARKVFEEVVDSYVAFARGHSEWGKAVGLTPAKIRKIYGNEIDVLIKQYFSQWATSKTRQKLVRLAISLLGRNVYSRLYSGVVIAGFGQDEYFPSLISMRIDGVIGGELKHFLTINCNLSRQQLGGIYPFAQDDMVYRFMEGIDQGYDQYSSGVLRTLFADSTQGIVDKYVKLPKVRLQKLKAQLTREVDKAFDEAMDKLAEYRYENFSSKIIDTVVMLPKEELANLAESLVSLTSMQRRVSPEVESVGGPIDVAVISKGDGFIWLKRKHYFDIALNAHFCSNYFRKDISMGAE